MIQFFQKKSPLIFIFAAIILFYFPVFINNLAPAPLDAMIGLYHPFRDFYVDTNPNGVAFKNFLITDPVRQIIVWKDLAFSIISEGGIPLWNPYEMAGKPLAGNFQTAVFYPLNIIFLLPNFLNAWSVFIIIQQILAATFMYFYLGSIKRKTTTRIILSLSFAFSGFITAWLEWGNVVHAYVWLPACLLLIEKIGETGKKRKRKVLSILLGLTFSFSFLAGHPQTTFYILTLCLFYFISTLSIPKRERATYLGISISVFILTSFFQLFQGITFLLNSHRGADQVYSQIQGWFLPYQHLVQFLAPDFFGNPATLNYWSVFNYAEFVGYIGIIPFLFFAISLFGKKERRYIFFLSTFIISLVFITKNPISEIPFSLSLPFISSSQPTRLVGIISFSMIILASFGLEIWLIKIKIKRLLAALSLVAVLFIVLWLVVVLNPFKVEAMNIAVTKRNILLPSVLFLISAGLMVLYPLTSKCIGRFSLKNLILGFLIVLLIFDLLRFTKKFTPFSPKSYYYPTTSAITYLQRNIGMQRMMVVDDRILAPNISTMYRLQNVSGYDPLYLKNYAELIVASERGAPNISEPFGFNRILTPKKYDSPIVDLLGVKYILALDELSSPSLVKVFEEGVTKIYENKNYLPRAFFVENIITVEEKKDVLDQLFSVDLGKNAILVRSDLTDAMVPLSIGVVKDFVVKANSVIVSTDSQNEGFLVVSDVFYPLITANIDGERTKIYEVDYAFRGVFIPKGTHKIEFKMKVL